MAAPSSLDGTLLLSGTWADEYDNLQPENYSGYEDGQGTWSSSATGGYSGFWFSDETDIVYGGVRFDGSAVVVIDHNKNNILDSEDYIAGYAYGYDNYGTSGDWERLPDSPYGSFSGGSFGLFEVSLPINYEGSSSTDKVLASNGSDTINTAGGNDTVNGKGGNDIINGGDGTDTVSYEGYKSD